MAGLRMARIAEGERVEASDRPRAHREDIAQNAADAGRRALIRLDIARMVVALHLEYHREPVADVDDARILARPLDHPRRLGRERAQMDFRGFIRAVLVPHRRENAELGECRHAADELEDARVFVGLERVLGDKYRRDGGFVADHGPVWAHEVTSWPAAIQPQFRSGMTHPRSAFSASAIHSACTRRTYFGARLSWVRTSVKTAFASSCRPALSSNRP